MSDIVERLCMSHLPNDWDMRQQAAAEIERLRKEKDALRGAWEARDRMEERLESIRGALEQIRQVCADNASEGSNHKMALDFVHQIVVRALKEQK